jgi:hypothetical protein
MKSKIIVVMGVLMCALVAVVVWRDDSHTRTLADGSRLVLSGVRVGKTNVYTHGTFLSKVVGRFFQSGLKLAGHTISPPSTVEVRSPENADILSAQFQLYTAPARRGDFVTPPFYRKFRLLITGDDGFAYVHEFMGSYEFRDYQNGTFAYLNAQAWPRTSRLLRISLEERSSPNRRDFRELATFVVKNPKRVPEGWQVTFPFRTNLPGNVEVEMGELGVRAEPHPSDIWESSVELAIRFTSGGQVMTNWGIQSGRIWDSSGNFDWFAAVKTITNGWVIYQSHRVLDPALPWRFEVSFARDSDFPETNLLTFDMGWPIWSPSSPSYAGLPVNVSFVNGTMLAVELPGKPRDLRLTFVGARDDQGKDIYEGSGSWNQHGFWRSLRLNSEVVNVHATVAIHPDYPASFILQPRYERSKPMPTLFPGGESP